MLLSIWLTAYNAGDNQRPGLQLVVADLLVRSQWIADEQPEQKAEHVRIVVDGGQEEADHEEDDEAHRHLEKYFPDLVVLHAALKAQHLQVQCRDDAVCGAWGSRL